MMKDTEAYCSLVARSFGDGAARSVPLGDETNEVIGALNTVDDYYKEFRHNFTARLERLASVYTPENPSTAPVLRAVNDLAGSRNWEGAYAELCAYDYFHAQKHWINPTVELDKNIDGTRTYSRELGKTGPANLDLYFPRFDVFADVKSLRDKVGDILSGIYRQAFPNPDRRPDILAQRRGDMHYQELASARNDVVKELQAATAADQRPTFVKSAVVPDLSFILKWAPGTLIARSAYSAYRHAEEGHQLVFGYADKLVRDSPCFIVLVNFPWFNQTTTDFRDANAIFYRSFARRVFCQYRHGDRPVTDILPKFGGPESVYDLSRKISALLFIEDRSIVEVSETTEFPNLRGFLYANPNADNPLSRNPYAVDYFTQLQSTHVDTFEHDNY